MSASLYTESSRGTGCPDADASGPPTAEIPVPVEGGHRRGPRRPRMPEPLVPRRDRSDVSTREPSDLPRRDSSDLPRREPSDVLRRETPDELRRETPDELRRETPDELRREGSDVPRPRRSLPRTARHRAPGDRGTPGPPPDDATQLIATLAPTVLPDTQFVGTFEGSGYREPPHLVRRRDGQLVRLPGLLWALLELLAEGTPDDEHPAPPPRTIPMLATALRERTGDDYTAEHVAFLVDHKLAPLGLVHYTDGTAPEIAESNAFLALRYKAAVVSERLSWVLAGLTMWLFTPLVLAGVLTTFVMVEIWALTMEDLGLALSSVMLNPGGVLVVVAVSIASAAFHEVGHAAACRYGGARPGVMGCGIYLVWPAFYTDITDSYRLGRGGRLRADLGGVYFNGLWVIAMAGLYGWTGNPVFLVAILSVNMEILQQLLPSLRFDGYHIMADLVGIPDLFKYIGPILRRVLLRRPADPRLVELKRWPQILISVWVLCVIPALIFQLGIVTSHIPDLIRAAIAESVGLIDTLGRSGNYTLDLVTAVVQILLLAIPIAGVLLVLSQILRTVLRLAVGAVARRRAAGAGTADTPASTQGVDDDETCEIERYLEPPVCHHCAGPPVRIRLRIPFGKGRPRGGFQVLVSAGRGGDRPR